jgi:hypothetical protein
MPIEKKSTGIFTSTRISGPFGRREQKAVLAIFPGTLEENIDSYEKAARRILKMNKKGLISKHAIQAVGDARAILLDAYLLRKFLTEGNAREAATYALDLGEAGTRMLVRPHEIAAKAGRPGLANLTKGRMDGKDRYNDARERAFEWLVLSKTKEGSTWAKARRISDEWVNPDPDAKKKKYTPSAVYKVLLRKKINN